MKLNNKGQVLVMFILLIPLLLLILGFVINYGMTSISKNKIDSTLKNIIQTNVKDIDIKTKEEIEDNINQLITINLGDVDKDINVDNKITITITKKIDSLFPYLTKNKTIYYTVTMEGIKEDNNIKIIRR